VADPVVRTATPADTAALLALWEVAGENDARPADSIEAIDRLVARDPDAVLVAVLGERVVGSIIAGWDGWRAHLYRLAVHPDVRRRGVGRLLVAAAAVRLEAVGATRLDAMVLEHNALGHALWRAEGFTAQPQWRRWVRPVRS